MRAIKSAAVPTLIAEARSMSTASRNLLDDASRGGQALVDVAPRAERDTAPRLPEQVRWLGPAVVKPVAVFVASRVLVLVTAMVATHRFATRGANPGRGPWPQLPGTSHPLLATLARWDSAWYVGIARVGYPSIGSLRHYPKQFAFFPLLPALIRWTSQITGLSPITAGILVSLTAGAVASVAVWHLTSALAGRAAADRAVLLVCFFPAAFVFSMPYAEGLIIAGVAGSLLAAHRHRWLWAGVLGSMVTAARPNAAVIVLALGWAAFRAVRDRREWRAIWAPVLSTAGILTGFGYLWFRTGDQLAWLNSEKFGWHDRVDWGVHTLRRTFDMVLSPHASLQPTGLLDLLAFAGVVFTVVGVVYLLRWDPPTSLLIYAIGAVGLAAASENIGLKPRLVLGAFPLIIALAVGVRGWAFRVLLAVSAVALVALSFVTFSNLSAAP